MDEEEHNYYFTIPNQIGNYDKIYITVESYYQNIIPNECTTGMYDGVQPALEVPNPILYFEVHQRGSWEYSYVFADAQFYIE